MEILFQLLLKGCTIEALGVAGVALGLFQSNTAGLLGGLIFIALSIVLTKEDE